MVADGGKRESDFLFGQFDLQDDIGTCIRYFMLRTAHACPKQHTKAISKRLAATKCIRANRSIDDFQGRR
jgi:hypothetical protein